MSTPIHEQPEPQYGKEKINEGNASSYTGREPVGNGDPDGYNRDLLTTTAANPDVEQPSPSRTREEVRRLEDDLAMLEAEQAVSNTEKSEQSEKLGRSLSSHRSRSRKSEPIDEFEAATHTLHEQAAVYRPPENPTTSLAKVFKKIHNSSFLIRYFTYITPIFLLLLIPLLLGALVYPEAHVGGVQLLWFSIWLEIVWLTLWGARIVAKCIPFPMGIVASIFTNNAKKWRDLGTQLEVAATLFFWWLGIEISFLPTMKHHHVRGGTASKSWELIVNKIIISVFVGATLNFIEKIIIQLIAIRFHLRTYADRIELNKFQIGSLTKLYAHSKEKIAMEDHEFEKTAHDSGTRTPMQYAGIAQRAAREALSKVADVAGVVAGDFTGKKVAKSSHPHQVVLTLLSTTSGSQVLARRLYRTFVRDGSETVFSDDLKAAFDNAEEAEAAFTMFDKDMNGDISMEELEAVCVEIGRERKSITASLKDLDSVVAKLDQVFVFIVVVITLLVFLSLISTSAAGVLTSAGSTILALSWLFAATAQEFLQSVVFVFVKHPFDVGDRVSIYGNTGASMTGDDYFVKKISLLYTEFKKMEGHVVQAPNSYLNTLFILNQRRSGGLAEAVPVTVKFGTTLDQIDTLRLRLLEFVRSEKREYQGNILTELRKVTENYSITLNVVFFYKSNWQNELLRLQRRNKFICRLMIFLQEIGIEGPRVNQAGAKQERPYHISYQGAPPMYAANTNNPPDAPSSDLTFASESRDMLGHIGPTSGTHSLPSILRNGAGTASSIHGRDGSSPHKHVDFSLGMQAVSSGDMISDVYWDRVPSRVDEVVRSANREYSDRRMQEQREHEEERHRASLDRFGSRAGRGSMDSNRTNTTHPSAFSQGRGVISPVPRNRFFSRLGSQKMADRVSSTATRGLDGEDDDLMEQGRYGNPKLEVESGSLDLRTGTSSVTANQNDQIGDQVSLPSHAAAGAAAGAGSGNADEHEIIQHSRG
jgi:small-conductance mechanosensitive channel